MHTYNAYYVIAMVKNIRKITENEGTERDAPGSGFGICQVLLSYFWDGRKQRLSIEKFLHYNCASDHESFLDPIPLSVQLSRAKTRSFHV